MPLDHQSYRELTGRHLRRHTRRRVRAAAAKHPAVRAIIARSPAAAHPAASSPTTNQAERPGTGSGHLHGQVTAAASSGDLADAALRRVLEVIDRRRPVGQLRPLLAPGLVDSVLAVSRTAAGHQQGAAMLRRIRLTPAGPDTADTAAEVFGTYSRGDRIHAIACRVEQRPAGNETRWLMVALHIG